MEATPHYNHLKRVGAFITSLEDNDLFLDRIGTEVNLLGKINNQLHFR